MNVAAYAADIRNGNIIVVETEVPPPSLKPKAQNHRVSYSFDSTRNYLPTRVVRFHRDGSISQVTELTYKAVVPEKAWLVCGTSFKQFGKGEANEIGSESWRQIIFKRLVGPVSIRENVDEELFEIEIPPNVELRDETRFASSR